MRLHGLRTLMTRIAASCRVAFTKEFWHTGSYDTVSVALAHSLGLLDLTTLNTKLDPRTTGPLVQVQHYLDKSTQEDLIYQKNKGIYKK